MSPTSPPPPPAAPSPAPSGGGGKKWLLFGCGGCLTLLVLGAAVVVAVVWFAMTAIKQTDVYQIALTTATQSPEVQSALGTPVESGWMMQGSVNINNGAGEADFNLPLSGPKASGTLAVKASRPAGGAWEYSTLEVRIPGAPTIPLNTGPPPTQ